MEASRSHLIDIDGSMMSISSMEFIDEIYVLICHL
jgi:hypothetical protein